jgi:hypothetical protein
MVHGPDRRIVHQPGYCFNLIVLLSIYLRPDLCRERGIEDLNP